MGVIQVAPGFIVGFLFDCSGVPKGTITSTISKATFYSRWNSLEDESFGLDILGSHLKSLTLAIEEFLK